MSVVVDATVLIDQLRGLAAATDYLAALPEVPLCPEIVRVEVVRGLLSHERSSAERLFGLLGWVPLDEAIAWRAGELGRRYRRSHSGTGLADLVVAATAQQLGADLATSNVRHFPMFEGLRPPYES